MSDQLINMISEVNFKKGDGLVPVVVQDASTKTVLMLGYMNEEAMQLTIETKQVTFYSRSRDTLWRKGETSGNTLELVSIALDCDKDTLLVQANPQGPTCHKGTNSCWGDDKQPAVGFLQKLESTIKDRYDNPSDQSYTASLFAKGINKVAQKVGEEAVELVIEAKDDNKTLFIGEAADLIYHYLVLLRAKGYQLSEVIDVLRERHEK